MAEDPQNPWAEPDRDAPGGQGTTPPAQPQPQPQPQQPTWPPQPPSSPPTWPPPQPAAPAPNAWQQGPPPGWWQASDGNWYPPQQQPGWWQPTAAPQHVYQPGRPMQVTNGMAIASLIMGILWLYWLGSVLALVFGYIGRRQIDQSNGAQTGRGMAVAGIVLGWIGVGVLMLMFGFLAIGLALA